MLILKVFADFADLRARRMRAYKGMLSVMMMKIRFRLRARRYGKYGVIKDSFMYSRHEGSLRYSLMNLGLLAGLPLRVPQSFIKEDKKGDKWKKVKLNMMIPRQSPTPGDFIYYSIAELRALKHVLRPFLADYIDITKRMDMFRERYKMIARMQRGIQQKLQTKDAKAAVLAQYWEQVLSAMIKIAKKKKNHDMIEFTRKVFSIPKEHRSYVLTRFVRQCREKHCLAFFQWRRMHRARAEAEEEIRHCIDRRIDRIQERQDLKAHPTNETMMESYISPQMEMDWLLIPRRKHVKIKLKSHNINSFQSIGWPDPFPDDYSNIEPPFL